MRAVLCAAALVAVGSPALAGRLPLNLSYTRIDYASGGGPTGEAIYRMVWGLDRAPEPGDMLHVTIFDDDSDTFDPQPGDWYFQLETRFGEENRFSNEMWRVTPEGEHILVWPKSVSYSLVGSVVEIPAMSGGAFQPCCSGIDIRFEAYARNPEVQSTPSWVAVGRAGRDRDPMIYYAPVPEPSSLVLVGLLCSCLSALKYAQRRRLVREREQDRQFADGS